MSDFPAELQGAVWHTTSHERIQRILKEGRIIANPDLPDSERWNSGSGPHTYPYVRTLGGVSLFEFLNFDPKTYSEKYPNSMWRSFVPYCVKWGASVWLEIDTSSLGEGYITGPGIVARWKKQGALQHTVMPVIEAASIVPIPTSSIRRMLESSKAEPKLRSFQQ